MWRSRSLGAAGGGDGGEGRRGGGAGPGTQHRAHAAGGGAARSPRGAERTAAAPRPRRLPLQAAGGRGTPTARPAPAGGLLPGPALSRAPPRRWEAGAPLPPPVAPRAWHRVPHPPPSSTPARCGAALVSLSPSSGAPLHTPHPRGLSRAHPLSLSLLIPFLRLEGSGEIVSRENTLLLAPRTQRTETLREEPSPRCPRRIGTGLGREVPAEVSPPTGAQAQPTSPPPPPPGPHLGRVFALARLLRCKAGRRLLCV